MNTRKIFCVTGILIDNTNKEEKNKMVTIQLTPKQVLEYVITGIKNGNYQAAINLAQDCIDEINAHPEANQKLSSGEGDS